MDWECSCFCMCVCVCVDDDDDDDDDGVLHYKNDDHKARQIHLS